MNTSEQPATTTTTSSSARVGRDSVAPPSALRRASSRSLVLAQSWVPFSVSQRGQAGMRSSTLKAAQAFNLLSSELASRRSESKTPGA
ncbi:MAG: hypothetical protein HZA92_02410 [Verrucomicrobia bacterium]|nr:hypothetical protein [Verrucomicrobiota bacterium]